MKTLFSNLQVVLFAILLSLFTSNISAHGDPPEPVPAASVIIDQGAAVRLGRALFWDQQLGSGNGALMACASCHYQAGTDSHPARVEAGRLSNDHLTSLGVQFAAFSSLNCDGDTCQSVDTCRATGSWVRTGVQSPPVIESRFTHSFWDGRANNTFNGVDASGKSADGVFERDTEGVIVPVEVAFSDSSQASQAIPPANSSVEMACDGRTFPELGYKMMRSAPLALQTGAVATDVQSTSYAALIALAFDARFVGDELVADAASIRSGDAANPSPQPSLTEQNFSLLFGLAIQAYEESLTYSGRTPTAEELVSMNNLGCDLCHADGLSAAMIDTGNNQNAFTNTALELTLGSPSVTDSRVATPNVGLFKTPHLLNLSLTAPYFHTGRADNLKDVTDFYVNGGCGGLTTDPAFCEGNAVTAQTDIIPINAPLEEDINNVIAMMQEMVDQQICEGTGPYAHPSLTLWLDDGDSESDLTMSASDGGLGIDYISDDGTLVDCESLLTLIDPPSFIRIAFSESLAAWRVWGAVGDNDIANSVDVFLLEGGNETLIGSTIVTNDGSWLVAVNGTAVFATDTNAGVRIVTSSGAVFEVFGEIEFR